MAQPVPQRDVPTQPWRFVFATMLVLFAGALVTWELAMRRLELRAGDLNDDASSWAEQRRRVDAGDVQVVILGDSRILFDTDLERFEQLTGVRPVQLALPGTNARPFLEELSKDEDFRGLAIVGIAELSYYREGIGLMAGALDRYAKESPSQRTGWILDRILSRRIAFLDGAYRLSLLLGRLDRGWRPGAAGPYNDVWKIATVGEDRQYFLWTRIEHDAYLRSHAIAAWRGFAGMPITDELIAKAEATTRESVARIRARGGDVVFVRPPSGAPIRVNEDLRLPRTRGWDALLKSANVAGVHWDDVPAMRGLAPPEQSHLSRACATVFTDAYVRELARATPRVRLRPDAPGALTAADCGAAADPSASPGTP